jgi:hypothetical protein
MLRASERFWWRLRLADASANDASSSFGVETKEPSRALSFFSREEGGTRKASFPSVPSVREPPGASRGSSAVAHARTSRAARRARLAGASARGGRMDSSASASHASGEDVGGEGGAGGDATTVVNLRPLGEGVASSCGRRWWSSRCGTRSTQSSARHSTCRSGGR